MSQSISSETTAEPTTASEASEPSASPSGRTLREDLAAALEAETETVEATSEPVAEAPADPEEEAALEAPARWSPENREVFSKLPREAQRLVLERHNEMESDYTRKTTELAEQRKPLEEFEKLFEPHKQRLALAGLTPLTAARQLLAAQNMLETNPVEGLKSLAQSLRVDLAALVPAAKPDDEYKDPAIREMEHKIQTLEARLQNRDQEVQRQNAEAVHKTIKDFADSKNADGTLKYPHFDQLKTLMGPMVAEGKTMEQAYELATYTLPETRERIASEAAKAAQAEALKKAEEDRKQKAKDVKGATQVIRSRGTATELSGEKLTLRQELAKNLRESGGRI